MQIGCALYTLDILIVPDTEYLLGASFMAAFAVKPYFHRNAAELGCPKVIANHRVPSFQTVEMRFGGGNLKLAVQGPRAYFQVNYTKKEHQKPFFVPPDLGGKYVR